MLLTELLTERKYAIAIELPPQALERDRKKHRDWFDKLFHDPDRDNPEYGMEDHHTFAHRVMRDLKKKREGADLIHHISKTLKKHLKNKYKKENAMMDSPGYSSPGSISESIAIELFELKTFRPLPNSTDRKMALELSGESEKEAKAKKSHENKARAYYNSILPDVLKIADQTPNWSNLIDRMFNDDDKRAEREIYRRITKIAGEEIPWDYLIDKIGMNDKDDFLVAGAEN